jgi:hypothetical protein
VSAVATLYNILPQLVEALRFEIDDYSPLAILLLRTATRDRRFACELFWQLNERCCLPHNNLPFGYRYRLIIGELMLLMGVAFRADIDAQQHLVAKLDESAMIVQTTSGGGGDAVVRALRHRMHQLDAALLATHTRVPVNVAFTATGVDVNACDVYKSKTSPIRVAFRGWGGTGFSVINKVSICKSRLC